MSPVKSFVVPFVALGVVCAALAVDGAGAPQAPPAQAAPPAPPPSVVGYTDTPRHPDGKWRVHDSTRPVPRVVAPGTASTPERAGQPPADAIVLIGAGADLSKWRMKSGGAPTWKMENGVLESGKEYLQTRDEFSDFQLHVEFATPKVVKGDGQGRGNSGVFLLGRFEVQVLDSFQSRTYPDGQAAAMYGQFPPLVNASRAPGEWQAYDIVFTAPRFTDGKLAKPAVVTVFHNGVVVHNATAYLGPTAHKLVGEYTPQSAKGPIELQDHGNPVHFRNIWIRPLSGYDQ